MKFLALLFFVSVVLAVNPPPGYPDVLDPGYPQAISDKWDGIPSNIAIDAAFQRYNKKIYFFVGANYYRLTDKYTGAVVFSNDTVDEGYPQSIKAKWGIDGPVTGAFQRKNGDIYLFSGTKYYRYADKYLNSSKNSSALDVPDAGYPKTISENFVGVPSKPDGAFYRVTGHIYFFKGLQYYRLRDKYYFEDLDDTKPDIVEGCYPKIITSSWRGAPSFVQAAFQRSSNQEIYFFSGTQYYRFGDKYLKFNFPNMADAGYPQAIATKFLQCDGNSRVPDAPDAIFQRINGKIYFFQGSQYWRVSDKYIANSKDDCVDAGYPKEISTNWIGVPNSIDGVFQRPNGAIYFFKGAQYYRVSDKYLTDNSTGADEVDAGYPQLIRDRWAGGLLPDSIDTVFEQPDGIIVFFKDLNYYEVNDKYFHKLSEDSLVSGFPRTIASDWLDIPQGIDAIFHRKSNEKLYAFESASYWRITDQLLSEAPPCCSANSSLSPTQQMLLDPLIYNFAYYTSYNADLSTFSAAAAQSHWLNFGIAEGRRASSWFDARYYLNLYADLRTALGATNFSAAALHFVDTGFSEGRKGALVTGTTAPTSAPTSAPTPAPSATPTLSPTDQKLVNPSVFNATYYMNRYLDLGANGIKTAAAAQTHWISNGVNEGRRGSAEFDSVFYLSRYSDLSAAFGASNWKAAVIHYVDFGKREGRVGSQ